MRSATTCRLCVVVGALVAVAVAGALWLDPVATSYGQGRPRRGHPAGAAPTTPEPEEPAPARLKVPKDAELEALIKKALEPTRAPLGDIRYVLEEIGADLPDPTPVSKGGPVLRKRPAAAKKKRAAKAAAQTPAKPAGGEPDWVAQLKALSLEGELAAARDEAVARIELIRQIGRRKSSVAVDGLLEIGFAHDGVFRDECGRNIRAMGGDALPSLIRHGQKDPSGKVRRYANYQLDRMDRAVPAKALGQRDDRLRTEILFVYGETRHPDAVRAVLGQTDAASLRVRTMARWAFRRYLTGPRPRVRKRKLKLPGGKESKKEHVWLSYRDIAIIAVKETLAQQNGEVFDPKAAAADPTPPLELAKKLFDLYDSRRTARWNEAFAKGQAKLKSGDAKGAVAEYDAILADDPFFARRAEMAPAYLAAAEAAAKSGDAKAQAEGRGLLRKARLLDPKGEAGQKAQVELARRSRLPGETGEGDPTTVTQVKAAAAPGRRIAERLGLYALGAVLGALVVISGLGLRKR